MTRCYGTIKRFWRRNDVSDIRVNLAAAVSPDAASFLSPPRLSAGEIINTSSSIIVSPGVLTRYTSGSSVSKDWLICGASAARLISVKACSYLQKKNLRQSPHELSQVWVQTRFFSAVGLEIHLSLPLFVFLVCQTLKQLQVF